MGGVMYRSTSSLPRYYLEMSDQLHAPASLSLRKFPLILFGWMCGWVAEPDWTMWRNEHF
jgi:hypothetical protein